MRRKKAAVAATVMIAPVIHSEQKAGAHVFWSFVGALAANILLDGVEGPWDAAASASGEILPP
jgi:hypothetical protein